MQITITAAMTRLAASASQIGTVTVETARAPVAPPCAWEMFYYDP